MKTIFSLVDIDDIILENVVLILNTPVDKDELQEYVKKIWDELTSQDDYDYDDLYDKIEEKYDVDQFIFLDNVEKIRYSGGNYE